MINLYDRKAKVLSIEEEREVFELLKNPATQEEAMEKLYLSIVKLITKIANKYHIQGLESDDMISIGTIGLMKAVKTFDVDRGIRFSTYSGRCIINEINMAVRLNKKYKELAYLDGSISVDHEGNELTLSDIVADTGESVYDKIRKKIDYENIRFKMKEKLSEKEKLVLFHYYGINGNEEYNQNEISRILDMSQSYVSRLKMKSIRNVKNALEREKLI